jgi:hypothetical protein
VLALNGRHFDAQLNLGGTLSRMGRLAEALPASRTALDLDPRSARHDGGARRRLARDRLRGG